MFYRSARNAEFDIPKEDTSMQRLHPMFENVTMIGWDRFAMDFEGTDAVRSAAAWQEQGHYHFLSLVITSHKMAQSDW
ncbi:MAG: hypothetical protein R3B91_20835 [Planctomycetaceae bacterium]